MESIDFCHCFVHCWHLFDQWIDSRNKEVPSFDNLFRHLPHSLFYMIICKIKTYQLTKKVTFGCENMQQYYMKWVLTNVLRLARGHCDRVVGTQMYSPNLYSNPDGEHWLSLFQGICDYNGSLHFRRNFPSQYPRSVVGIDLSQEIKERNWRKTGCTSCVINHKLLYFKYRADQKKIH